MGAIFADIFLNQMEKIIMNSGVVPVPKFYRRYIDDVFCTFNSNPQVMEFCNHINTLHPNIKFSIEFETSESLLLIDVLVERCYNKFLTSVYRKKTLTP